MTVTELNALARGIAPAIKTHISNALAPIVARLETLEAGVDVASLLKRIEALEADALRYKGIFDKTRTYHPGDAVTHRGHLWHCKQSTRIEPAFDSPGSASAWTLAAKAGRNGRDGKDATR